MRTIDYNRNDIASKILAIAPNPIVENFALNFYCNNKSEVTIDICDVMGRKSTLLYQNTCNKQLHQIQLKKPKLKAGLYVIRLSN